jgi:hypothetical protein
MVAVSIDGPGAPRILISGTAGAGKSAFNASVQPLPLPAAPRRVEPTVGPVSLGTKEAR